MATDDEIIGSLKTEEQLLQVALEQNFLKQNLLFDSMKPVAVGFTLGVQLKELALKYFPMFTSQTIQTQARIQQVSAMRSAVLLSELLGRRIEVPTLQDVMAVSVLSRDSLEGLARYSLEKANFWDAKNFKTEDSTAANMLQALNELGTTSSTQAHHAQTRATELVTSQSGAFESDRVLQPGACDFCVMLAEANNSKSWHRNCGCSVIQVAVLD